MKRFLLAASLAGFCLLTACSLSPAEPQPEALTTEDVKAAYEEAAEVYNWFDRLSPPCTGDTVEVDGLFYRQVDVEGLETYTDLEARVRSLFAPELADRLLSESQNFRDIDGKLYCAEGGRGDNIYLYTTEVEVEQASPERYDVELTFWADFLEDVQTVPPEMDHANPTHEATFGCSTETLHYEATENGFRFTDFCSTDGLDLDADTVYTFNYITDFETGAYQDYSDWQLLCYLVHADGAAAEAPRDDLLIRFLDRPQDILAQLTKLYASPFFEDPAYYQIQTLSIAPAYTAANYLYFDELPDFLAALDRCEPETPAQQEVLDLMRREFTALTADMTPHEPDAEFGLLIPGKQIFLTLGEQEGTFPWGFELEGTPTELGSADTFGMAYAVDCGAVQLEYCVKNGIETLYTIKTTLPPEDSMGYFCTPRGLYCGSSEDTLRRTYLHAQKLPGFESPDYDSCYVYEIYTKHIAAYLKDGRVAKLEIEDLIDGQLLEH